MVYEGDVCCVKVAFAVVQGNLQRTARIERFSVHVLLVLATSLHLCFYVDYLLRFMVNRCVRGCRIVVVKCEKKGMVSFFFNK